MDYLKFYKERVPDLPSPDPSGRCMVRCVFHEETTPSLDINVQNGKWRCYSPSCMGHAGGGYKKFAQLLNGEIASAGDFEAPPIDKATVDSFHEILLQRPDLLKFWTEKRGFTMETVKRFKLGFDGERFLIPIVGPDGSYVNIRKYKPGATEHKVIPWKAQNNRTRLFPIENLKSDTVFLCEGETDAMLACQLGLPGALTTTNGADTWPDEFTKLLEGKHVVLLYDADKAGRKGSNNIAQKLLGVAASVKNVCLPLAGSKEEKDLTDWAVKLGHTREELLKLVESTPVLKPLVVKGPPPEQVTDIHLSMIGLDKYVGRRVRSRVLVAGKDTSPFAVPRKIAYSCNSVGSEKMCDKCGICKANGQKVVEVPEYGPEILQMVMTPIEKLNWLLGKLAEVPEKCPKYTFKVPEGGYANVESIKVIPEIDFKAEQSEYVIRNVFYLGHGMETNRTYEIEGVAMPEPKTQYATVLVYRATQTEDSIEKFTLTPEALAQLAAFRA